MARTKQVQRSSCRQGTVTRFQFLPPLIIAALKGDNASVRNLLVHDISPITLNEIMFHDITIKQINTVTMIKFSDDISPISRDKITRRKNVTPLSASAQGLILNFQ